MQSGTPATAGRCRWCRVAAAGAGPAGGFPVAARRPAMRAEGWYDTRHEGRGGARRVAGCWGSRGCVTAETATRTRWWQPRPTSKHPTLPKAGRVEARSWTGSVTDCFYRPSNWIVLEKSEGDSMVSKWSRPRPRDDLGRPLPPTPSSPVCSPLRRLSMLSAPGPPRHLPYFFLGKERLSSARPLCLAGAPRA